MATKTILVPVDFSEVTAKVVGAARELAGALGGHIILLHVSEYDRVPPSGEVIPGLSMAGFAPPVVIVEPEDLLEEEQERLDEVKADIIGTDVETTTLVARGRSVSKILEESEAQKADLIVMGSHGHGAVYNLLVGSVTEGVLKSAKCPVLVVPSSRSQS